MLAHFLAVVHKDPGSDFGVSFPDFRGCVSAGSTLQEAIVMAEEALQGHVDVMVEYGDELPEATTDLVQEELDGAFTVIAVKVRLPSLAKRINITIEGGLLERIDDAAAEVGLKRSQLLALASKEWLERRRRLARDLIASNDQG